MRVRLCWREIEEKHEKEVNGKSREMLIMNSVGVAYKNPLLARTTQDCCCEENTFTHQYLSTPDIFAHDVDHLRPANLDTMWRIG